MHYRFYSPYMRVVDVLGVRAAKFPPKTPPKKVWAENAARRNTHGTLSSDCDLAGSLGRLRGGHRSAPIRRPVPASPFCNFATLRIDWISRAKNESGPITGGGRSVPSL